MNAQPNFPLRQRKYARTKLALMNAALERLREKPLEEISVRELCEVAEVSEATFFNYFPGKTDLLVYFVQLWIIEAGWHAQRALEAGSGLGAIEAIFEFTARRHAENPEVMAEMIAYQARRKAGIPLRTITEVEKKTVFPDLEGIEQVPAAGLDSILPGLIAKAVEQGELAEDTDISTIGLTLAAVFFGIPIVQQDMKQRSVAELYRSQLNLIWAGLKARTQKEQARRKIKDTGKEFSWI
ncbi:TetR/AcrR family transcriptional regulator [Candidatus Neomarinimicrobiota bacterium]